jgi:hypothetical protein
MNQPFLLPATFLVLLAAGLASVRGMDAGGTAKALRPFYIIGHGANTLAEARNYLDGGANGLEVDVNIPAGQPEALCIGHGPDLGSGGARASVPLADFLRGLHALARSHTNFCLVYFDCKTLAATPERGRNLLGDIRTCLIGAGDDRMEINVLISVGTLADKALFADIAGQLGPREGLMVDGLSNPLKVSKFFQDSRVRNQAYCDGIVPLHPLFTHFMVYGAVRKACKLRDQDHKIRFVGVWSVNNPWLMIEYIKMGVDGIVVDGSFHWYNFCWVNMGKGLHSLTNIVHRLGGSLGVRAATRADNPFSTHK